MLRHVLFDLDDTLYDPSTGLWEAIGARIDLYMIQRLGVPAEAVPARRRYYRETFGTALNGLQSEFHVDAEDYLRFVHDLPLAEYLRPDPALNGMLARLPLRKSIFTNADAAHARRVLEQLGVARHFQSIIDIRALEFENKPEPGAYLRALRLLNARAEECVLVEDSARNLRPAHRLGMLTILRQNDPPPERPPDGADYWIADVLQVERILAGRLAQAG